MGLEGIPHHWDVVVVGAGIAGSVAAYRLVRRGLQVLLVERADWPRDKVCGGCLNAPAIHALTHAGLADVAHAGPTYTALRLACGGRTADIALPAGRALSRQRLDELLAARAMTAGARFLTGTQAALATVARHHRLVRLRRGGEQIAVTARLVLACDGLGSRLLADAANDRMEIAADARIGVGALLAEAPDWYRPGQIHMACGSHGYVGLVRVEAGQLQVGAALDPAWIKQCGGPADAVAETVAQAGFPACEALRTARWGGTPYLTRRRNLLGADRVLILGDAAGYVEPFTGEGMAWAVTGALAVERYAHAAIADWQPELVTQWTRQHRELIHRRQAGCQALTRLLRRPRLLQTLLPLVRNVPGAAASLACWLHRDYPLEPVSL